MKRLSATLLSLLLVTAPCGGSAPEQPAGEDDIPALSEAKEKQNDSRQERRQDRAKDKKKPAKARKRDGRGNKPPPAVGTSAPSPSGDAVAEGEPAASVARRGERDETQSVAAPIPAGRYEFATEGKRTVSGSSQDMPETTTFTAATPAQGVQRQTRDLRDSEGNGTLTETDLVYRDDGVFLSYVKVTARFQGGLTDVREFRLPRPELIVPAGGGPGYARTFTMQGSGTRARVAIKARRYDAIDVGGDELRALVVQTDITFSGALEGRQRSVTWFWPRYLLPLKERVRTDVRNGPIRLQSNYEAIIRRVR